MQSTAPESWRVLIDPAGHPFCITNLIPESLDVRWMFLPEPSGSGGNTQIRSV
jgi:hypothetical protein